MLLTSHGIFSVQKATHDQPCKDTRLLTDLGTCDVEEAAKGRLCTTENSKVERALMHCS